MRNTFVDKYGDIFWRHILKINMEIYFGGTFWRHILETMMKEEEKKKEINKREQKNQMYRTFKKEL